MAIIDVSFGVARTVATTLLFEKSDAESRKEIPDRVKIERLMTDLVIRQNLQAIWCGWELNQFDGKDSEFVGKEYRDEGAEIADESYVSQGCFIPWFYRDVDERGNPKSCRQ